MVGGGNLQAVLGSVVRVGAVGMSMLAATPGPWVGMDCLAQELPLEILADSFNESVPPAPKIPDKQQSIVIASDEAASDETASTDVQLSASAVAPSPSNPTSTEPKSTEQLQPIANTSEYIPDPATPRASTETKIPTPADPVTAPSYAAGAVSTGGRLAEVPGTDQDDQHELTADLSDDVSPAKATHRVASFHGVTPGVTTRSELLRKWGEADSPIGASILRYKFDAFPTVTVQLEEGLVEKVQVSLAKPMGAKQLAARLNLNGIEPVVERDAGGAAVATAFPGRGVVFGHQMDLGIAVAADGSGAAAPPEGAPTYEILIQRVSPDAFLLRAEQTPARHYAAKINDLETALEINPTNVDARLRLSELALRVGQVELSEELASEAVDLRPRDDAIRLQRAKCLMQLARYDEAVAETRKILEAGVADPLTQARALHQMGLLAALGSKQVAEKALPLQNKAIELADKLALDADEQVAGAAAQLLVDAHLAVADRIAVGDWQQKEQSVAQWVGRASALAEQMIADGRGDQLLRLQVALSALQTSSQLDPPVDPELWVTEAEDAVNQLADGSNDQYAETEREWQLGLAYLYASEIQHRRGEADRAFHFGDRAQTKLEPLAEIWSSRPDVNFILGRVFFQNGAVQAVHYEDHEAACQYYDRAVELLMKPAPVTAHATPSRHGDALVSMGVSYWRIGQRDQAHRLTKAGFELVQQGVAEGLLNGDALEVPKSNLASMNRALGLDDEISPVANSAPTAQVAARPQPRDSGRQPAATSRPAAKNASSRTNRSAGRVLRR